ncbi:PIG-L deacetylase family protein [Sphingomonas ginsenosidivorax]|uniref:PIG-L deacetylase family protein n=1 Tax=Sphingomonas ginsenosidivorax TaxID=862135 RepID=UPI001F55203E|nr:PIG-L family deacetylase [Sphingomonas ginsenosidivorax]
MVAPGHRAWSRLLRRARPLPVHEAARGGPWLVLAPHPDDESLGCGALMATLAAAGSPIHTAFLTDGAGSHPDAPGWSARRIAGVRAREAAAALHQLGGVRPALHLGWPDAAPVAPGDLLFRRSVARLSAWCRRHGVTRLAVTWSGEPHCDHEAAAMLAQAVATRCGIPLYQYLVWGWTLPDLADRVRGMAVRSLVTAAGRPRQHRAIRCHRTQLGGRIAGARENFRLPRAMLRLADRPITLLLEVPNAS